ncbi:hypothetical protein EIKCOROL_02198 [Eikenella corrodens ATCC 23834]|uniref:Uncharacterized protein n=1 Tax=Eikenella corrodens ATCC 23834 TaxID=546274 RepID=C0DXT6_EIKCO|nr:hypothetical protein EIKCOROL_02198 [Eikenella corrodens ATCC 23834]
MITCSSTGTNPFGMVFAWHGGAKKRLPENIKWFSGSLFWV